MARKPAGYWQNWDNLIAELQPFLDKHHGLLPAGKNGIHETHSSLSLAITKYHGGMKTVRKRLGIDDKKYCCYCERVLPFDSFRLHSKNKNGKHGKPEYYRDSKCKECSYKDVQEYRATDMGKAANICRLTKARAKRKGWSYDIDREWVLNRLNNIDWRCEVTDIPFERTDTNFFDSWTSISIDRIDSNRGYTKDNIQFVLAWVNKAKGNLPMDLFIDYCKAVAERNHNEK